VPPRRPHSSTVRAVRILTDPPLWQYSTRPAGSTHAQGTARQVLRPVSFQACHTLCNTFMDLVDDPLPSGCHHIQEKFSLGRQYPSRHLIISQFRNPDLWAVLGMFRKTHSHVRGEQIDVRLIFFTSSSLWFRPANTSHKYKRLWCRNTLQ
jgi:hypothetical protein